MLDIIGWFTAGLSLTGNWFVIKKHWLGFLLWIIANTIWVIIDINIGIYSQAGLFAAFNVLAVIGMVTWIRYANKKGVELCYFDSPGYCQDCKHAQGGKVNPLCISKNYIQVRYSTNKVKVVCLKRKGGIS
ncbi:MAG: hypothetical protein GF375_04955 [Candidatus Omnitrophica bacterium]|nr:hypothetical protein [Candidatus Omnitrophota bacterium]